MPVSVDATPPVPIPAPIPAPAPAPTESSLLLAARHQQHHHASAPSSCPEHGRHLHGSAQGGVPRDGDPRDGDSPPMARKMHLFIPATGIGIYLVAIDQLLTVATYAKIGSELNALNSMSWIATSFFLTLTSFQPLYGKLSDIFGRKECLLFAYAVFGLGCLGCGLARDIVQLCISRAVAGIGGGGINAVVSILLSDLVPLRERGVWQGYLNILYAAGSSTGAPLGGILADSIGWRWSFLAQVPLCCMGWIAVYFLLDVPRPAQSHWLSKVRQIDFLGAFVLVAAVVALLAGLDSGPNLGWSHRATVISLSAAPVLFGLFVLVQVKVATHPFAPSHVIFGRGLFACYFANFFGAAGNFAVLFFLPLSMQAGEGFSAAASGALLVPAMIAGVLASVGGGWVIKRTGKFYAVSVLSYGVQAFSILPLALSVWFKATAAEVVALMLTASGSGSGLTTTLIGLLANAATQDTAVVVACSYLFRSLGSSVGISVSSAVLQQVLRAELATRLPNSDDARQVEGRVRQNIDYIKKLPPPIANIVRKSYRLATAGALVPALAFSVVAFLATFWVRTRSLKY
ncbi:major facilitator superfamily protein [Hirsutella rhossiliensis]|uniref:Major facilitator superfamily domain-containing protein n=1 Tax=Hirsutella rhossiliensis TaxID=111463 RepID=A0A9P8SHP3_9HYPO|nr:major facilitator superfamily domain-containing protein [Hirsutella rhossiliensis]KAH0963016.1 major facilitator superfamily domain-containing protein [Hirsutella rhossiliensis]